jgi:hypothetical protein
MMEMKLHLVFLDAGLEAPQIAVDALVGGSRTFIEEVTAFAADTVRTVLPLLIKGGIATAVCLPQAAARYLASRDANGTRSVVDPG